MMNCVKLNLKDLDAVYTTSPIPKVLNNEEIVVQIVISGICGTDLHIIENQFRAKDGVILGHEFAGTVYEKPLECEKYDVGDRVVVNPNISCSSCQQCKKGLYNFCEQGGLAYTLGIMNDGGWAKYCKAHISLIHKISDDITYEQAVLCEPLSCIVHALDKLATINIGSDILIIGAGIIGLLWCNALHVLGHRRVTISEPNISRRETVKNLNLGYKCMSWDEILQNEENSPDWKVDLCIDCSGNTGAIQSAIPLLHFGATILIFGVADPTKTISISPFEIFKKEITLMGTAINTPTSFHKAVAMLESLSTKYITMEGMNMKKFPLQDFKEALNAFKKGNYTKIVFEV